MNVIGIDVSKTKLDCLWLRGGVNGKVKTKAFKNRPEQHKALLAWAVNNLKCDTA